MTVCNKRETDSQVQGANWWLPMGRGKGEGQEKGMRLRDINYYV